MQLSFEDVTFHHGGGSPVLCGFSAELERGWTIVRGAAGTGKSTLLHVACGHLVPLRGRVHAPVGARVALIGQRADAPCVTDVAFMRADDGSARQLRIALEIEGAQVEAWDALPPSTQRRIQVGAALWDEPDILLVDAPHHPIDAGTSIAVAAALAGHRGVGVAVADGVLDALATRTLWMTGDGPRLVPHVSRWTSLGGTSLAS